MDDRKLVEDLYSVTKPWFVSCVVLDPSERVLHAYLDREESCSWQCPVCSNEYCISDHLREREWPDLYSGIYHVYLYARILLVE